VDQKIKTAANKIRMDLLPLRVLKGVARVFAYGSKKYKKGNWFTATDDEFTERYPGGALRHFADAQNLDGTFNFESLAALDKESGLPEIDHMICGLIMLRGLLIKRGVLAEDPGVGNDPPVPGEYVFPVKIMLSPEDHAYLAAEIENPRPPTQALRDLMTDKSTRIYRTEDMPGKHTGESAETIPTHYPAYCFCQECEVYRMQSVTPLKEPNGIPG
jgi:hypothetical protein